MRFHINHRTSYYYYGAATESFMEARLRPAVTPHQKLISHQLDIEPATSLHTYTDYFGNAAQTFSIVQRHEKLTLTSDAVVETKPTATAAALLEVNVSEARQIFRGDPLRYYEYLTPSAAIVLTAEVNQLANRFFRPGYEIGEATLALNHWINDTFTYAAGSTQIDTSVATSLKQRTGVCQDFAQVMIAILRSAEIPARYVVGYIETDSQRDAAAPRRRPRALIGAAESHAWVEVCLSNGEWWPLDPTNDCVAGERHVRVATGRDYHDCTPTRGVFKGTTTRRLEVTVAMQRA
ncbi:transglutaminase family protein [Synoicihabitans lomoniglobus]|uniref:Transglutaminase family protein n=1 Tax=Synoicihabitans lomoniglobus TaxID=2909285 RepID=A0AAE9ZVL0_9BACT|nr:transglutaminase family protein [Opitutaceae bacterium LMO-M01]WED64966.1 transglutaminase family protein [Opitutaceae bacterium LMO-M01]